ncbi:LAME_0A00430g1_1 [Lachancea meyersii CBS 8951]|uniref:LAME_0A00430g1_1 n=1 Tax=Lachancea meyersii CBS 8951 TaxID=1266667 RepID=A0A1G4IL55_9SACH|nr:LAME_0A00430g1_1 [Lachancea meyersii CBS 8951]
MTTDTLVSADWLKEHLNDENLVVVDATLHLPDTGRNAREEYTAQHIPNALFFDLDDIADRNNPRPRKIPPYTLFAEKVGELGITERKLVVVYDTRGLYSAARVWWLFRQYGHDEVKILDGGLPAWLAINGPVENGTVHATPATFSTGVKRNHLALWNDVLHASQSGGQILDARPFERWAGTQVDRYPGTRQGHIPNSLNLCWSDLLENDTHRLLQSKELKEKFEEAGLDLKAPVIASCGSGVTACILALGLNNIGHNDWKVYDGSWDEWGRNFDLPIATLEETQ